MPTTVNGYPVLTSRTTGELPRLRKVIIPGPDRHFLFRDGSCAMVLGHAMLTTNDTVERLDIAGPWDEWGHAVRPVRGQTSGYSNHAGGVAGDFNAVRHPIGVPIANTFTKPQIAQMRKNIARYDGIVIWGGEWSRPDGMHLELAGPKQGVQFAEVEALAKRLTRTKRGKELLAANPGLRAVIFS